MNYQDLVSPNDPKSWRNTQDDKNLGEKRFTMNGRDFVR